MPFAPAVLEKFIDRVREFPLVAIRSEADHAKALAVVRRLMLSAQLKKGDREYLDALTTLVDAYERQAIPANAGRPHERLKFLVDESGLGQAGLQRVLGISQPAASLLLSGKRNLSVHAIKILAAYFRVSAGYFL